MYSNYNGQYGYTNSAYNSTDGFKLSKNTKFVGNNGFNTNRVIVDKSYRVSSTLGGSGKGKAVSYNAFGEIEYAENTPYRVYAAAVQRDLNGF